jgi:hypothetical protein
VVKIRKGTSCKLILRTNNLDEVHDTFYQFAEGVMKKADVNRAKGVVDPSYGRTIKICETVMEITSDGHKRERKARQLPLVASLLVPVAGIAASILFNVGISKEMPKLRQNFVLLGISAYALTPYLFRTNSSGLIDSKLLESKGKN